MSKVRILVIGGGPSPERQIALLSSKAVFAELDGSGEYQTEFYDWDGTTGWLEHNLARFDLVLPILHGAGGEDGVIQQILEQAHVPYLGSSSAVSAICFDKQETIHRLNQLSVRTPAGAAVDLNQYLVHPLAGQPHVLKPHKGGSSIDTYILADVSSRPLTQIKKSFAVHGTMLLEEYIDGIEITVPVLDGELLPIIEIQPPKNGTFDYVNKYNGQSIELCPAKNLSDAQTTIALQYAQTIYQSLGCRHLARIDMIARGDEVFVLEVNTLPGMTAQSLYPKSAAVAGLSFAKLVKRLVQLVRKDA